MKVYWKVDPDATVGGSSAYNGDIETACTVTFYEIAASENGRGGVWRVTYPDGTAKDARFTFTEDLAAGEYVISSWAFPDGHQVVPFLPEEDIAVATLDHGIQDIQFLPIDIISAGSASQSGQSDEKNHQTQTGPLLPTLFPFHDAGLLIVYVQKSISIYPYYHSTKYKK